MCVSGQDLQHAARGDLLDDLAAGDRRQRVEEQACAQGLIPPAGRRPPARRPRRRPAFAFGMPGIELLLRLRPEEVLDELEGAARSDVLSEVRTAGPQHPRDLPPVGLHRMPAHDQIEDPVGEGQRPVRGGDDEAAPRPEQPGGLDDVGRPPLGGDDKCGPGSGGGTGFVEGEAQHLPSPGLHIEHGTARPAPNRPAMARAYPHEGRPSVARPANQEKQRHRGSHRHRLELCRVQPCPGGKVHLCRALRCEIDFRRGNTDLGIGELGEDLRGDRLRDVRRGVVVLIHPEDGLVAVKGTGLITPRCDVRVPPVPLIGLVLVEVRVGVTLDVAITLRRIPLIARRFGFPNGFQVLLQLVRGVLGGVVASGRGPARGGGNRACFLARTIVTPVEDYDAGRKRPSSVASP
ncbi:hypothetical protein SHIRM173S_07985 [Streptomyces hirsutus]